MKKIIVSGAVPTNTLHKLKQEVPEGTDIIVIDEHIQGMDADFIVLDTDYLMNVPEPKAERDDRKKRRKDFWNDLPKPKRRRK